MKKERFFTLVNSGGCDRRKVERTELSLERQMHDHVARRGQRVTFDESERDEECAFRLRARHQVEELLGAARLVEEDEHITFGEDPDVTMERVDR